MRIISFIENHFGLLFVTAAAFGLFLPEVGIASKHLAVPIMMAMLFVTFLKVEIIDVFRHLKRPGFLLFLLVVLLVLVPTIVYYVVLPFSENIAIALLLAAAIPMGVAAPALTDIVKGNTSLSLSLTMLSYVIAPFSLVGLLYVLTGTTLELDLWGLFVSLLKMIVIPLIAAQLAKQFLPRLTKKIEPVASALTVILVSFVVYIVIAEQASVIIASPQKIAIYAAIMVTFFIVMHLIGYFIAGWRPKKDKIALSMTNTYRNTALAIVLAVTFFPPEIALISIGAEIPWFILPGTFKSVVKYLP